MSEIFVQHLGHDAGADSLPAHCRPMRDFVAAEALVGADPGRVAAAFAAARAVAAAPGVTLRPPRPEPRAAPAADARASALRLALAWAAPEL